MDSSFIIVCPNTHAEEIQNLIKQRFPELDIKIYTEKNEYSAADIIRKAVEEALKQLDEKDKQNSADNDTTISIPDDIIQQPRAPWEDYPAFPNVLMYGCIPTTFHTISQAEESLKNNDNNANIV
ncbi:hypothetical protein [uncultured Methanobrevibacter sp.]|uniref:hypothetical protein n=1 Tax=uncultured Methanobrevibacter sp. TaxID=253161 RepID=UPI0025CEF436|nr:hypothetical protein [uncultured Methanobrevibacter sp.]